MEEKLLIGNETKTILNALHDGVLIIDHLAIVRYVNPAYTRITGVNSKEIIGKPIVDVRRGARLPKVLEGGEKILLAKRMENGVDYFVNMSPIYSNGRIVGGISLVLGIKEVLELSKEVKEYRNEIKNLENRLRSMHRAKYTFDSIISEDKASREVKKTAYKIAQKETSILITGESGTGKELYAQAIHNASKRKEGPFVPINCAAFNPNLLESELFGYQQGAFTGASKEGKAGLFEAATQGTIFLDEISEMDVNLQSKLLRVLQEGVVRRVGSIKEIPIDVRVIAATNKNLEELILKNDFREDLYYRIAVFPLNIPPLRDRTNDIMPIIRFYIEREENKIKRRIDVCEEAERMLIQYDWPGNIRELRNSIEFAYNMMDDSTIEAKDLPMRIQRSFLRQNKKEMKCENLADLVRRIEKQEIEKALVIFGEDTEGKKEVAKRLGISLATLYNKLSKF